MPKSTQQSSSEATWTKPYAEFPLVQEEDNWFSDRVLQMAKKPDAVVLRSSTSGITEAALVKAHSVASSLGVTTVSSNARSYRPPPTGETGRPSGRLGAGTGGLRRRQSPVREAPRWVRKLH